FPIPLDPNREGDPKDGSGSCARASPDFSPSPSGFHGKRTDPSADAVALVVERFAELAGLPLVAVKPGELRHDLIAETLGLFGVNGAFQILEAASRDETVKVESAAAQGQTHWTLEYIFRAANRERLYAAAVESERRRAATLRRTGG